MNHEMTIIIAGAALVTYITRFPLLLVSRSNKLPPGFSKYLSFIAPAVLTALIAPVIFVKRGAADCSFSNRYILATAITVLAARFSGNTLVAVLAGVLTVGILVYIG